MNVFARGYHADPEKSEVACRAALAVNRACWTALDAVDDAIEAISTMLEDVAVAAARDILTPPRGDDAVLPSVRTSPAESYDRVRADALSTCIEVACAYMRKSEYCSFGEPGSAPSSSDSRVIALVRHLTREPRSPEDIAIAAAHRGYLKVVTEAQEKDRQKHHRGR